MSVFDEERRVKRRELEVTDKVLSREIDFIEEEISKIKGYKNKDSFFIDETL